jgi:hypothetical protein
MPRPVTISQVIKVTKWSTYSGESNVSEHQPELFSGEPGTIGAGATAPAASTPVTAAAEVESPKIAPEQEETAPKADAPKADALKADPPNADAPKAETPKVEPARPATSGTVVIMSPGDRPWNGDSASSKADAAPTEPASGKRRFAAMAAVVALATVAGALGGALATAGLGHMTAVSPAAANSSTLEASVARIDADIAALKASVEHTSKVGTGQFNKTSDRLDKVEKAQAEPAAKLARLSEAVEKLRAASVAAPVTVAAPVAAKDVTGSVAPPATAVAAATPATPAPVAPPKPEVARLPTVEGWVLRDVGKGTALIESRRGMFEVYAGDPIPGLGRVDAIRKQDGRWVVVTSKGLIVAR